MWKTTNNLFEQKETLDQTLLIIDPIYTSSMQDYLYMANGREKISTI